MRIREGSHAPRVEEGESRFAEPAGRAKIRAVSIEDPVAHCLQGLSLFSVVWGSHS